MPHDPGRWSVTRDRSTYFTDRRGVQRRGARATPGRTPGDAPRGRGIRGPGAARHLVRRHGVGSGSTGSTARRLGRRRPPADAAGHATTRSRSVAGARWRQPTQVRRTHASSGWPPRADGQGQSTRRIQRRIRPPAGPVRAVDRPDVGRRLGVPLPRPPRRPARRRSGCRSASRSAGRPAGRSAPPCRSPATAGSRARPPGRPGPPASTTSTEITRGRATARWPTNAAGSSS